MLESTISKAEPFGRATDKIGLKYALMAKKRKMSNIKFEKGDTLGGTAPLLMMNSIRPGPRTSPGVRRFGRTKQKKISSILSFLLMILFLAASIFALTVLGWDQIQIWIDNVKALLG